MPAVGRGSWVSMGGAIWLFPAKVFTGRKNDPKDVAHRLTFSVQQARGKYQETQEIRCLGAGTRLMHSSGEIAVVLVFQRSLAFSLMTYYVLSTAKPRLWPPGAHILELPLPPASCRIESLKQGCSELRWL